MKGTRIVAALAAVALPAVCAQFVPAPTDLISKMGFAGYNVRYKEVPSGICETMAGVKTYSGYVDVAPNQHLFFLFFEARNVDPSTAPLTLWLDGGPGDPSMISAFGSNGPCRINSDLEVENNPFSWNNVSNMLYLDQPTQTGFSYSIPVNGWIDPDSGFLISLPDATCPDYAPEGSCGTYSNGNYSLTADSTNSAAPNVWKAVQGFMGAFPQYSRCNITIGTESYGGHYGPVFAEYFEQMADAKNVSGAQAVRIHSLMINNGWYDPIIQYPSYYTFIVNNTYEPGLGFNQSELNRLNNMYYGHGNCVDKLNDCNARGIDNVCTDADNFCFAAESVYDTITGRDEYDLRELSSDPFPNTNFVYYLNLPNVQQALGAYQNFSYAATNLGAGTVSNAFGTTGDDARELGIISKLKDLVQRGVYVLAYHGDADYNCNWLGGQQVAEAINVPGFPAAGFQNITTPDNEVHGVVKQSGNYTFARIYQSGHFVPFYKPQVVLELFKRVLAHTDVATGTVAVEGPSYKSTGPAKSTYFNGPANIQYTDYDNTATYNIYTNVPDYSGTTFDKRSLPSTNKRRFSKLMFN